MRATREWVFLLGLIGRKTPKLAMKRLRGGAVVGYAKAQAATSSRAVFFRAVSASAPERPWSLATDAHRANRVTIRATVRDDALPRGGARFTVARVLLPGL